MSVTLRDLQPINTWKPDLDGPKWSNSETGHLSDGEPEHSSDSETEHSSNSETEHVCDSEPEDLSDGEPQYLIDTTTGRNYWNQSKGNVRCKCFLLTLFTPIVHPIASVANVAYRIGKLASFSHLWMKKEKEESYSCKGRLKDAGQDALRILTTPLALIGLECAAIYGIFSPYNGRKLYASIERAQYGNFIAAPCFQPDPQHHALGGDPRVRDAF